MDARQWFYEKDDEQVGPVGRQELDALLAAGRLTADSYVWVEGMEDWQTVGQIPELAALALPGQTQKRPTSVTVFGILNIVFGAMGLLCSPFGLIFLLTPQPDSPLQTGPGMKVFSLIGFAVGLVFSSVLLASGVGLLTLKRWARKLACLYAWAAIGWTIVSTLVNALLMFNMNLTDVPPDAKPAMIGGMVGGICGGMCVGLLYPIILLIFLRKPHVIDACEPASAFSRPDGTKVT